MRLLGLRIELKALRHAINELCAAVKEQTETNHPAQEPDDKDKIASKPIVVSIYRDQQEAKDQKDYYGSQQNISKWTRRAVIAASIYAGVAAFQYWEMRKSNEINREALWSVQRAIVSFQDLNEGRVSDPEDPDSKHSWDFTANLENTGNTAAQSVVFAFNARELPQLPTEQEFMEHGALQSTSIAPKTPAYMGPISVPEPIIFGIDLGPKIEPEIASKTHRNHNLFAWGWVRYKDVFFPNTDLHVSEWCYRLSTGRLITRPDKSSQIVIGFDQCGSLHNCQDRECKDYEKIASIPEPN